MFVFEKEGFLEVEPNELRQLSRSKDSVSLNDSGDESYLIQAVLCVFRDNDAECCRVAFHSKALQRALVYSLENSENKPPWQLGQESLALLGFELEEVNLKQSPAMLEVVLKNVPGLLAPTEARKLRAEKEQQLAEFRKLVDEDPDSAEGKRAALKLGKEKRLNALGEELYKLLAELLATGEEVHGEVEALNGQLNELTGRLEAAVAQVDAERKKRELSEAITAAAEKRIQELEADLVDYDTKTAEAQKQKKKVSGLQKKLKDVNSELNSIKDELGNEQAKQEQLQVDLDAAREQAVALAAELQESRTALQEARSRLTEQESAREELGQCLKESERQVQSLEQRLDQAEKHATQGDEAEQDLRAQYEEAVRVGDELRVRYEQATREVEKVRADRDAAVMSAEESRTRYDELAGSFEGTSARLTEADRALREALDANQVLEERLAAEIKAKAPDETTIIDSRRLADLTEQNEALGRQLDSLQKKFDKELSLRRQLEKQVADADKRIDELEASPVAPSSPKSGKEQGDLLAQVDILQGELGKRDGLLEEERASRVELERELDESQRMIDSLEKLIRENEQAVMGRIDPAATKAKSDPVDQELLQHLKAIEDQLEGERIEKGRLASALVAAEKKIAGLEESLSRTSPSIDSVVSRSTDKQSKGAVKSLPHEVRPAPKKGALFHPDWDLIGLPCQDVGQVQRAWESLFNVNIPIEGYQSQYCTAYLVVLKQGSEKKLYLLFNLKKDKHTLVCVPGQASKDGKSLEEVIKEGLQFLKLSGFEMEPLIAEHVGDTLSPYFLNG